VRERVELKRIVNLTGGLAGTFACSLVELHLGNPQLGPGGYACRPTGPGFRSKIVSAGRAATPRGQGRPRPAAATALVGPVGDRGLDLDRVEDQGVRLLALDDVLEGLPHVDATVRRAGWRAAT
jgi:hypothetical protein